MRRVRVGDPNGAYRRRIRLVATEPGVVVADLEDDFHRFRVTVRHGGQRVVQVGAESLRFPWSTCPDAGVVLHELEGSPLSVRVTDAARHSDPRRNCTHMFDLAGLAIAHAARGAGGVRQYDAELPPPKDRVARPRLWRDGALLLTWTLERFRCVDPPPFSEAPWKGGFIRWADATLPPEDAEAAIVLRRACDIGMGRGMDLDGYDTAAPLAAIMSGVCFTMQPDTIEGALRNKGVIRDFTDDPDGLLADDDA